MCDSVRLLFFFFFFLICLYVSSMSMSNVTSKHLSKPINFNGNDVTFCVTTRTQNSSSSSAFPFMQTESPWTDADAGMRSRSASPSVLSDGILSFRAAQVVYAHISLCPPPTAHTAHTTHTTHTAHAHCVPTCPQVLSCFAKGRVPSDMAAAPQPCLKVNVDCAAMPSGHHMHGLSANPEMVTVLGGDDNEGEEEEYHQHEMGLQPFGRVPNTVNTLLYLYLGTLT